ncbi:MAG: DUF4440 domain-containing protein [Mameliella sp.]|nr:DUF4440 domain-containing protein [Mameliella sp.]
MPIPSDPIAKPDEFPAALARAWNRHCGQSIAALFTEDADFVNVSGLWWQGREAIAKPHDKLLQTAAYGQTTLTPDRTRTRYLTECMAQIMCQFTLSGRMHMDGSPREIQLWMVTALLQRQKAKEWLALNAQFTGITAGSEALIAMGKITRPDHITPRDL